jgi:hypothetical protein
MDRTTCVVCGLESGYNRVVVELPRGETVGGLCRECEADRFGDVLARTAYQGGDCALCDRDGFFALPRWEPYTVDREGTVVLSSRFDITDRTPTLCDEDYHDLLAVDDGPRAAVPGGRS